MVIPVIPEFFGCQELGNLISKVQATVISNGSELERMIVAKSQTIKNLDDFLEVVTDANIADGVYLATKRVIVKSKYSIKGIEPDLLIFVVQRRRICKVVELKDGDSFDTKKSLGEKEHLEKFATEFGAKIPFVTEYYICCFNQEDKEVIKVGFKNVFDMEHIMTGRELCRILGIDYDEIIALRQRDARDNLHYFLEELFKIERVQKCIKDGGKQFLQWA